MKILSHKYAVIDVETTGLSPQTDRIVELGVILLGEDLEVERTFETLINPQREMDAQFIHKIRDDDVADAPTFAQVAQFIAELLDNRILVAHNARFDLAFLNAEMQRSQRNEYWLREHAVCTMDQSRIYAEDGSHSLTGLCKRLGIAQEHVHRGLADAFLCYELLRYFVSHELSGTRVLERATNRNDETVLPAEWLRARPWRARKNVILD